MDPTWKQTNEGLALSQRQKKRKLSGTENNKTNCGFQGSDFTSPHCLTLTMANVFLLDYQNVLGTIANFPWHSICRFLGQHQQMFKLFEKVLQTYCVKFSPLIFSFVCQRLPKSIHSDSNFRFLVKNFGRTASSMSHTGSSQSYVNCHKNKRSIICVANNAAEYK